MSQPLEAPRRLHEHARRPWTTWILALLLATFVPSAAFGGYQMGKRATGADLWDPIWLRAYQDRPMDTSAPGDGFWISGYYVDYDRSSLEMVKMSANHMDQVVIFGYGFDREGNLQGKDQQVIKAVTGSQKRVLLFGNLTHGAFDKQTAHAILTDPVIQDRAIQNILRKSTELEVAGVQIDFEDILLDDRDAYTAFLKRLRDELHPRGMHLSIAAAAKTRDTRTGWGGATDYAAIGQIVDYFYIMAYDEHWRGGEPGPVASLTWTEQVVRYATGVMPAQKIILGLPFYGYDWTAEPGGDKSKNKAFGANRMASRMEQLGAKVRWDPVAAENVATFRTADGERIAWYPDHRSVEAKLKLAYQYNLKGIAPWRLGFEPDAWWHDLGAFRAKPVK